jgi:hypothetical protein
LAIIPLPVIILFGALALPLRKDQPMEIYLAAMVSYYLKPHKRLWDPDGIESLVEITVPKVAEVQRTKNLSQTEAQARLGYLANIVDSQGWAVRGLGVQAPTGALSSDIYFEAEQAEDVLDSNTVVAQTLDAMIGQSDAKRRQAVVEQMHQPPTIQPAVVAPIYQPVAAVVPQTQPAVASQAPIQSQPSSVPAYQIPDNQYSQPTYNPYPADIQQSVIQPMGDLDPRMGPARALPPRAITPVPASAQTEAQTTSEKPLPAGIINLASNTDLSIETMAREAHRIQQQEDMNQEVVISLR